MPNRRKRAEFERLFMPHLGAAYNLARWLMRHPQDAEDMVQDAYLKAYKSFGGYAGGDPAAWLLAIVRNCCLTWLKRQAGARKVIDFNEAMQRAEPRAPAPGQIEAPPRPDEALASAMDRQRIEAALRQLPESYRVVIVLREFEDLSYRQIAQVIGTPVGTVMSRLSRARAQMKDLLQDDAQGGQQNEL